MLFLFSDLCDEFCLPLETSFLAWDYPGIGRNLFFLYLQAGVFFAMTLAIDFQLPQKLAYLCRGSASPPPQGLVNPDFTGKMRTEVAGKV